jgi:hypothetical protein
VRVTDETELRPPHVSTSHTHARAGRGGSRATPYKRTGASPQRATVRCGGSMWACHAEPTPLRPLSSKSLPMAKLRSASPKTPCPSPSLLYMLAYTAGPCPFACGLWRVHACACVPSPTVN